MMFIVHATGLILSFYIVYGADASPTVEDRPSCQPNAKVPPTRVNTTGRLDKLRAKMDSLRVYAYIVPIADNHGSEYISAYEKRLQYISGFGGSAGMGVITKTKAALWTDGRYFLEAEGYLNCKWILMKRGLGNVPEIYDWLISEVPQNERIGVSPWLFTIEQWAKLDKTLRNGGKNLSLTPMKEDIVGNVWDSDELARRPVPPGGNVEIHPFKFAGKKWQDKIDDVRKEMKKKSVQTFIVSRLEEIAWLLNMRGSDILYTPVFMSFVIIDEDRARLYLRGAVKKLKEKSLRDHLKLPAGGQCITNRKSCVEVIDYDNFLRDIEELKNSSKRVWLTPTSSYILSMDKAYKAPSPIALMKSIKNSVERRGMFNSHIRDAVAVIKFNSKLEREVKAGKKWTEVDAADDLLKYRAKQEYNRGASFETISAVGSNGAIIHYRASDATNKLITTKEIYLQDSGGQYLDGTTDITRTFHFGTPTDYEKETYTLVLRGAINLARFKWPEQIMGNRIDVIARAALWQSGLQYLHGTGHGIGHYLGVHEGPSKIWSGYTPKGPMYKLYEGQFLSDEPGYYEDGKFGIRLETIMMVDKVQTKYRFKNFTFFTFKPVTLVPFERNLINLEFMKKEEIKWLNDYHAQIQKVIGPILEKDGSNQALEWLKMRTAPYSYGGSSHMALGTTVIAATFTTWILFSY